MTDQPQGLQRLLHMIPGYTGYQAMEQRRDADKALRTYLAQQFAGERQSLERLAQQVASRGQIEYSERIEQINQALTLFIARLESAPRGYTGWFDAAPITTTDLDQIYEFDAKLADSVPLLREQLAYAVTTFESGGDFDEALHSLRHFVDNLNIQFDARQSFLARGRRD